MNQTSRLEIVISTEAAKRNAELLNRELQSIERNGDFATNSMDSMSVAARKLAGYMAGIVTVGAAISRMDAYTGINNKLKLVTSSQEELNQAMNDTFAIAQRSNSAWSAVNDVYSKYLSNAKTLNLTQAQTARLTEITSKAVATSGSTTEAAAGALFQYGQALDGNILRAEEYNSLVDGAGGLLNAMAKGLNVTRGELRQMMLDGKLTGEVITQALLKAGDSVDALYAKTDITVGQSLTLLSNELTKFVGESGKGSGAAKALSESIRLLSQNLDSLTNLAMIGGAYWLGTYIPAIYKSINAGTAKAQSVLAEMKAEQLSNEITAQRTARILHLTAVELANAEASAARMIGMQKVAYVEKTLIPLQQAHTAALNADTVAQEANNAARSLAATAGRGLLSLLGGPVGLGLTVASVAATFLLMRDNSDKVTKSLNEQGVSVQGIIDKYQELDAAQKRNQQRAEQSSLSELQATYDQTNNSLKSYINNIGLWGGVSTKTLKVIGELSAQYRSGQINAQQLGNAINKLTGISEEDKKIVDQRVIAVNNANAALEKQRQVVTAVNAVTDESAKKHDANAKAAQAEAAAIKAATQAYEKYRTDAMADVQEMAARAQLRTRGLNDTQIEEYLTVLKAVKYNSAALLTEQGQQMLKLAGLSADMKAKEDAVTKARQEQTKELEKQQQLLKVNAQVTANASKYNFAGLESKYGLPAGMLSAIHMIESRGNANAYNKTTGAAGGFQMLSGTAKQYGVKDRYNLAQSAEGAAKYLAHLLDLFNGNIEKAVRAYHAGEGNVQRGTGMGKYNNQYIKDYYAYMAGKSGFSGSEKDFESFLNDQTKLTEKSMEEAEQIRLQYMAKGKQDEKAYNEDLRKIRENAALSATEKTTFETQAKSRYDAQLELAKLQQDAELNGYKWNEDQKLKYTHDLNTLRLNADDKLIEDQKALYRKAYDAQYAYDLEQFKKNQQKKLDEYRNTFLAQSMEAQARIAASLDQQKYGSGIRMQYNSLQREYASRQYGLDLSLYQSTQEIGEDKGLTDDQKYQTLLKAQKAYQDQSYALSLELAQKEKDLQLAQQDLMLSSYSTIFGGLADAARAFGGEQSAAYQTMFALQQSFAIASATMAAWTAYTQAFADPSAMTLPQKLAGAATVMAAAMPAISAITSLSLMGQAHNGWDELPKSGTYNLEKGERVVSARQNRDLTDYIANSRKIDDAIANSSKARQGSSQSQPAQPVENNIRIVNSFDESELRGAMATPAGEKIILNVIKRNRSKLGF